MSAIPFKKMQHRGWCRSVLYPHEERSWTGLQHMGESWASLTNDPRPPIATSSELGKLQQACSSVVCVNLEHTESMWLI